MKENTWLGSLTTYKRPETDSSVVNSVSRAFMSDERLKRKYLKTNERYYKFTSTTVYIMLPLNAKHTNFLIFFNKKISPQSQKCFSEVFEVFMAKSFFFVSPKYIFVKFLMWVLFPISSSMHDIKQ